MESRRRIPRRPASWTGTCHIEGESAAGWRDCQVIDISVLGLGIMFDYSRPSELPGRRISVDAPAVGDSVNIRLEGKITNAATVQGGCVRVGIEFVGLSEEERAITAVLCLMSTVMVTH